LGFDGPQHIRRIFLHIIERETEREQEFVLRYSSASETNREIVRQQWTFSPTGSAQSSSPNLAYRSSIIRHKCFVINYI
jgi:hypothetical protein